MSTHKREERRAYQKRSLSLRSFLPRRRHVTQRQLRFFPVMAMIGLASCLLILWAPAGYAKEVTRSGHAPLLGRYQVFPVPLNENIVQPVAPFCHLLANDLNQFQSLPFDTDNPRLSSRYPQLRRPHWTPMPWDRRLAKEIFTGCPHGVCKKVSKWSSVWRHWLKRTKALRREGKTLLWRTTIDLAGNGQQETLIRIRMPSPQHAVRNVPPIRVIRITPPRYCRYIDSKLDMLPSAHPRLVKKFNKGSLWGWVEGPTDMIYDTDGKQYYMLGWQRWSVLRGATETIGVSTFTALYGYIPECYIGWIPYPSHTRKSGRPGASLTP